jgi:lipopolysaccharide export system protein LptA
MNSLPRTLLILGLTAFVCAPVLSLRAEENIAADAKDKADSIMADPRLRNMLRTVKEDPAAALEKAKTESTDLNVSDLDPDEAVRRMTKAFADNKDKIDPEKLKSAVATVKESGLAEKATAAAASVKESGLVEKAAAAVDQLAPEAAAMLGDVPATRPAPGISGGIPTPVAMPVEPGEAAPLPLKAGPSGDASPVDSPAMANTAVDAIAGASPTRPMIPESPGLTPDEIPGPVPLEKKYAAATGGNYPGADKQHMQILSKESIMDNAKGILLFRGNVLIAHPEFEIKCDKLEIHLTKGVGIDGSEAGSSDSPFKRAVASGGMVEIKRTTRDEKGKAKTQIAIARIAEYNAVTKDIILSGGPPYIQDGERFVKTNSEDARIIMRGNGLYEITGSGNRSQIVIPVEQKENTKEGAPGGKKKNETGIGSFGNAFDELR